MPGFQYLDNNARLGAIQDIGQTGNSLATALPQLQIQAQAFRQRLALQRAQELLNEQRMKESQARAKLYEGEDKLHGAQVEETQARTREVKARTEHTQGQEEREKDIATAAFMHGQAAAGVAAARQTPGGMGPYTPEQSGIQDMLQAASVLMQRNPQQLPVEMNTLLSGGAGSKPIATRPGEVLLDPQTKQPIYTNQQPYAAASSPFNLSPGQERFGPDGHPIATNTNVTNKAKSGGLGANAQAILDRMHGGGGTTAAAAPNNAPKPGTVYKGYRFKGGDPAKKENWEPAQ